MKTKFYTLLSCCVVMLAATQASAQCGARYHDKIFPNVTVTSDVTYSTANNTTLKLDIYEPTGDTDTMRPLLIMAHGGSFVGGSKTDDPVVVAMCNTFAQRGYVCASINYRLGQLQQMVVAASAKDVVMKAISDGKSAIRFFKKDAATANVYKIDPAKVFVGGNSAGAVLYAHVVYIDSVNEAPSDLRTIINANGGIDGNSGNDGYSSEAIALFNLAGGLNEATFVSAGNKPSFNAQGDQDVTVPYNCANAQGGLTPVQLCGLGAMEPLYTQYSIHHQSIVYPGEGHCPWQNNAPMMTQLDTQAANFFYPYACTGFYSSVNELTQAAEISVFPNPASSEVNIRSSERIAAISVLNNIGQVVFNGPFETTNGKINTTNFAKGIYMVKIEFASKNVATAIRKVVIE